MSLTVVGVMTSQDDDLRQPRSPVGQPPQQKQQQQEDR
jgi:hypothetical protein